MPLARLRIWPVSLLVALTLVATTFAASDDELPVPDAKTAAEISALIKQMGDESYSVRETATEKLLTYGLPALKIVEEATKDPDREIRYRCDRVRVLLREIDLQRRLEAFAADVKGEKDHGLPAWDRFAALHGGSGEARQLFVDIFRAEPELLKTLQIDPKQASDVVTSRVFQMQQNQQVQPPTVGTVAALLFAGAEKGVTVPDQQKQMIISFCFQPALREVLTAGAAKQPVMRSLVGNYLTQADGYVAYYGVNLALQYDLKEGLEPARRMVKSRGGGNLHMLQMPILALAKMGDISDVAEMAELLEDKTPVMNFQINNQKIECQVRDLALVSTLHLLAKDKELVKGTALESGDLKAFGFDRLEPNVQMVYQQHTIGFTSDDKRQEVFKKWGEVKEKLKDKLPKPKPAEEVKQ
jgi:hypothetical protein